MAAVPPALVDTDTLSEILRGRDPLILQRARDYLAQHGRLAFSLMTRYEILRGLQAKGATAKLADFERFCSVSEVLPLTDAIIVRAAELYADLKRRGQLISDADLLIAATALVHGRVLVTNNLAHFQRIPNLPAISWRTP
jgi:tRNA(fMet)-specific endonuclease VapC